MFLLEHEGEHGEVEFSVFLPENEVKNLKSKTEHCLPLLAHRGKYIFLKGETLLNVFSSSNSK